jgi:hypothetical protein
LIEGLVGVAETTAVSVELQNFIEGLVLQRSPLKGAVASSFAAAKARYLRHPPPGDLEWVAAIPGGMVAAKRTGEHRREGEAAGNRSHPPDRHPLEEEFTQVTKDSQIRYCKRWQRRSPGMQRRCSIHPSKAHFVPLYGRTLVPMRNASGGGLKRLLEIGLGCTMIAGPGQSVPIWQHYFPAAERWEAEYDAKCSKKWEQTSEFKATGLRPILTGDQGNSSDLQRWLDTANADGAGFDAVIDDGGHRNNLIAQSFKSLWPAVRPGGVYYIEDLQTGRSGRNDPPGTVEEAERVARHHGVTADFMEAVADGLVGASCAADTVCTTFGQSEDAARGEAAGRRAAAVRSQVAWLFCGNMACGLGKVCE